MKKIFSLLMVAALTLVCFAGCGSKDKIRIGVQTTTTGDIYASGDFGEDAVTRYDNGAAAVEALKTGKVDAVIIDNEPAKSYVAANTGLKILETEYAVEDYAICFKKGSTLKDAVNGALEALIADGSVKKIVDKYINNSGEALKGVPVTPVDTDKPNLVMATNAEFPPYEYVDKGGMFYGIDVEVAQIIADKLGYDLVIENVNFDSIIPGVQEGKYDMGMAGMTVTPERLEMVDFSSTYATGIQVVIVKEGGKIQKIEDLDPYYLPKEAE